MKPLRIDADTSVIGGCFDAEFSVDSLRLLEAVRKGRLVLLLSEIVLAELADAPQRVREVLTSLSATTVEKVEITEEVLALLTLISPLKSSASAGRMMRRTLQPRPWRERTRLFRGISNTSCGSIK